jgi:pectinacetylesterase
MGTIDKAGAGVALVGVLLVTICSMWAAATEASTLNALACASSLRLCDRGEGVQCSTLGATWSDGRAKCRPDCSGYNVSHCKRANRTFRERVRPADRDPGRWAGARCNNGSPFSFQVRLSQSGHSKTWVIGLEGGALCDDNAVPCSQRPPPLTTTEGPDRDFSSAFVQNLGPLSGPFDLSVAENPTFADANHVWAHYCSSDYYSGGTTDLIPNSGNPGGWYFSGRHNVKAMLEILKQRFGLDDRHRATKILLLGQSAGGSGVAHNADTLVAVAPKTALRGNSRLLLEGSWEPDINDPGMRFGVATTSDHQVWQSAYAFWHARSNDACERGQASQGLPKGDCYLAKVNYPSLADPVPVGLGLPVLYYHNASDPAKLAEHNVADPASPNVAAYGALVRSEMASVKWLYQPSDGRYIGRLRPFQLLSPFHVISSQRWWFDLATPVWGAGNGGNTFKGALTRFWMSKPSDPGERATFTQFDNLPPAGL